MLNIIDKNESQHVLFNATKTVLGEIIKVHGLGPVITMLEAKAIPKSAIIYKVCYLSDNGDDVSEDGAASVAAAAAAALAEEIQQEITIIIKEITTARDKTSAIKKLHALKQKYPSLDIHEPLQTVSSALRRFVTDTLTKLGNPII
jgi:hypothetical protein